MCVQGLAGPPGENCSYLLPSGTKSRSTLQQARLAQQWPRLAGSVAGLFGPLGSAVMLAYLSGKHEGVCGPPTCCSSSLFTGTGTNPLVPRAQGRGLCLGVEGA